MVDDLEEKPPQVLSTRTIRIGGTVYASGVVWPASQFEDEVHNLLSSGALVLVTPRPRHRARPQW